MTRRGFTLVELLIGMVLLGIFGVVVTRTLSLASRSTRRALDDLAVARTITSTGALLREELGESSSGELVVPDSSVVEYPRPTGHGPICATSGTDLLLRESDWQGTRWPEAGRDEVRLLGPAPARLWSPGLISAVAAGHCPDGASAIRLTLATVPASAAYARVVEPMRLRGYLSAGSGWWGLLPASGVASVQPFAGPLATPIAGATLQGGVLTLHFRALPAVDTALRILVGPP